MLYTQKSLKILVRNSNDDFARLDHALKTKEVLEDTVEGNFLHKGDMLIVYPKFTVCFLAEIINCRSNQPRGYIPKSVIFQDEKPNPINTQIKYKIKDILSLSEKSHKVIFQNDN